jgi:hypothetical protein
MSLDPKVLRDMLLLDVVAAARRVMSFTRRHPIDDDELIGARLDLKVALARLDEAAKERKI